MDSTRTAVPGERARIAFISSIPEPSLSERSTIAASAFVWQIPSSASAAVSASPQILISGTRLIRPASPSRSRGWSSTRNTLDDRVLKLPPCGLSLYREHAGDGRTCYRTAHGMKGSANKPRAQRHDSESHAFGRAFFRLKACPIVLDPQLQPILRRLQRDRDTARMGVSDRVPDRFLRDSEQMLGHGRIVDQYRRFAFERARDTEKIRSRRCHFLKRGH